jgi:predicted nucleic acid-binding protein
VTLVDSNVVIDVLTADPIWLDWSVAALRTAQDRGVPRISDVTCAELAARYDTEADLQRDLDALGLRLERPPQPALFLAGRAYAAYRASGGPRTSLLADFFIGAHAEAAGLPILTRDPRRYRTYFPGVALITP